MSSELFRDNSRGMEGGAFSIAVLLNRKKAKSAKGKDNIDALKEFIVLKGEACFSHFFLAKYNLNPDVDNTPDELKKGTKGEKAAYIHSLVNDALKDLLPMFEKSSGVTPDMTDYPVGKKYTDKSDISQDQLNNLSDMVDERESIQC